MCNSRTVFSDILSDAAVLIFICKYVDLYFARESLDA